MYLYIYYMYIYIYIYMYMSSQRLNSRIISQKVFIQSFLKSH